MTGPGLDVVERLDEIARTLVQAMVDAVAELRTAGPDVVLVADNLEDFARRCEAEVDETLADLDGGES